MKNYRRGFLITEYIIGFTIAVFLLLSIFSIFSNAHRLFRKSLRNELLINEAKYRAFEILYAKNENISYDNNGVNTMFITKRHFKFNNIKIITIKTSLQNESYEITIYKIK